MKIAVIIAFAMIFTLAVLTPVAAQQTVEDQYWEAVKNSTNAEDFRSYLREYPNGKYAALARLKAGQKAPAASFLSFKTSMPMTNEAFLERWENHLRPQLPITIGNYEIYRSAAPTSVENYYYNSVRTTNPSSQLDIRGQAKELKARLLSDYCSSEAYQRKITVVLGFSYRNSDTYSHHLAPYDCKQGSTNAPQTDAEYLNAWAAEVRVGLPEWIAGYQLKTSWSRCPDGCKEKDSSSYLVLKFGTEGEQQNARIDDLKRELLPSLLQVYCQTEAPGRDISLGVFFDDRGQQADYNNFWVSPNECPAKTIQN